MRSEAEPLRLWAVIPTYNHVAATRRALASLLAPGCEPARIVVVDNASTDGTTDIVGREFPGVTIIEMGSNAGFAAAANAGLRLALGAGADLVFVSNNDVVADPPMLRHLVRATGDGIGAAAPVVYYMSEPDLIWSSGFRRGRLLPEMRGGERGMRDTGGEREPFDVDYLLGCALLLSRPALAQVGLFDERYFFYYEDLDLSLRMRDAGFRLRVVPAARMWHEVARSAQPGSSFRTYHMARGSAIFVLGHTSGAARALAVSFRLLVALRRTARYAIARRPDLVRAHLHGLVDGWRSVRREPGARWPRGM